MILYGIRKCVSLKMSEWWLFLKPKKIYITREACTHTFILHKCTCVFLWSILSAFPSLNGTAQWGKYYLFVFYCSLTVCSPDFSHFINNYFDFIYFHSFMYDFKLHFLCLTHPFIWVACILLRMVCVTSADVLNSVWCLSKHACTDMLKKKDFYCPCKWPPHIGRVLLCGYRRGVLSNVIFFFTINCTYSYFELTCISTFSNAVK